VLEKAVTQLGLKPHLVSESVLDNCNSLIMWGMVDMREGEENYQRKHTILCLWLVCLLWINSYAIHLCLWFVEPSLRDCL